MKITDLIIDPKSVGNKLWLVDVIPAYEYKDGVRTDKLAGYRYSVAMPERGMDKINVKIEGEQQADKPDTYAEVKFTDLEIFIYWSNGQPQIGARAKGVTLVNAKPQG